MDIQRANENLAGGANYAEGDTKYNADILGTELARVRGFIDEGQDATDMDPKAYSKLYDEAYTYLTQLNRLNRPPKKEGIKSIDLAKELEELTNKNLKERGLGEIKLGDKLPPPKNKKPPVDPELKKSEDLKKEFKDFEDRNKKGQLFNLSGQKGDFLTEDEFARELESNIMNFKRNSPGFNLQLIPNLKKPGAKAYNPYPDKQGDKFLTDNQRQRVLSSLEDIMKNEEYQMRFGDNFADLMEEGDTAIEFAPDLFKIDPPKKADGGRIGFGSGSTSPVGVAGNQTEPSQMQGPPVATGIMATPEGMTAEEFARANPTRQQILNPPGPVAQPPVRMQGPQMGGLNFLVPMNVGKKFPTSGGLNELRKFFGFFWSTRHGCWC